MADDMTGPAPVCKTIFRQCVSFEHVSPGACEVVDRRSPRRICGSPPSKPRGSDLVFFKATWTMRRGEPCAKACTHQDPRRRTAGAGQDYLESDSEASGICLRHGAARGADRRPRADGRPRPASPQSATVRRVRPVGPGVRPAGTASLRVRPALGPGVFHLECRNLSVSFAASVSTSP